MPYFEVRHLLEGTALISMRIPKGAALIRGQRLFEARRLLDEIRYLFIYLFIYLFFICLFINLTGEKKVNSELNCPSINQLREKMKYYRIVNNSSSFEYIHLNAKLCCCPYESGRNRNNIPIYEC